MNYPAETVLEIDLEALAHNLRYLRSKLNKHTKLMGVVKAFAYGNDSKVIADKLVDLGVDYLAVAYSKEGIQLRENGIKKPILIFHPQPVYFDSLIENELTPTIYSRRTLKQVIDIAESHNKTHYPVHLILNTGMNRLGLEPEDLDYSFKLLNATRAIKIEGLYSHFAVSDDKSESAFTHQQIRKFEKLSLRLMNGMEEQPFRHFCNTSGILNYPEAHFDLVRTGIGLFGFGNSRQEDENLRPVGQLKSIISQIHHIKTGDTVGYNRSFKAERPSAIAVLPLGYADGLHRQYGNEKTVVWIKETSAPIIGDICMDMTMIDITGIDCEEGDAVLIFGKNKSAERFAQGGGTISYELITGITPRVDRKIIS